jgi:glycosyltransferase involved in cell wall biosynthesis
VQHAERFPPGIGDDEASTLQSWFDSPATIVVSSEATVTTLSALFGVGRSRFDVIPLSGRHSAKARQTGKVRDYALPARYLLCPANVSFHKNHEVLLDAFARWGSRVPLILTGGGTDLGGGKFPRQRELKERAYRLGLELGRDVHGLGFVPEHFYRRLLERAWAVIMPTLAEGGGSFPVWEALFAGIPVICSDIPVMREMVGWTGGEVLWFKPDDPVQLARILSSLYDRYDEFRGRAIAQVDQLHRRSWREVAEEYGTVFARAQHRSGGPGSVCGCHPVPVAQPGSE